MDRENTTPTKEKRNKPEGKPNKRKQGKKSARIGVYLVLWVAIVGLAFALMVGQAGQYNILREDYENLQRSIAAATARNYDLLIQLEFYDSEAYIEQRAREWLGMVRPNEIVFRNISGD